MSLLPIICQAIFLSQLLFHTTNTVAANCGTTIAKGMITANGTAFYTNIPTLNIDFSAGNYVFVATNNAFPISGFINYTNGLVNWQCLSYSNSAATAQTVSWPAGCVLYGTNSGTSVSVYAGKVCKVMISVDPQGTNLCAIVQSN